MAKLINAISTNGPTIDKRIKNKINLMATAPISERVALITGISIWAVAEQLEIDNMLDEIITVNCIFTSDGEVTFTLDDNQLGSIMRLIIYPMERWKSFISPINNDYPIYLFIIEELAHHYWGIEDEIEVNYKVIEIMKHIFPNIEISDIYSEEFMADDKNR